MIHILCISSTDSDVSSLHNHMKSWIQSGVSEFGIEFYFFSPDLSQSKKEIEEKIADHWNNYTKNDFKFDGLLYQDNAAEYKRLDFDYSPKVVITLTKNNAHYHIPSANNEIARETFAFTELNENLQFIQAHCTQ